MKRICNAGLLEELKHTFDCNKKYFSESKRTINLVYNFNSQEKIKI